MPNTLMDISMNGYIHICRPGAGSMFPLSAFHFRFPPCIFRFQFSKYSITTLYYTIYSIVIVVEVIKPQYKKCVFYR